LPTNIERLSLLDELPLAAKTAMEATDYHQAINILKRTRTPIPDWLLAEYNEWLSATHSGRSSVQAERYLGRVRFTAVPRHQQGKG